MKTRPHKEEMIRFANSEVGTEVWVRPKTSTNWGTMVYPTWNKDYIYVVDNEYAELRKKSIDEDRPIQVYSILLSIWKTPTYELDFSAPIESYRLEPKENPNYVEPIACYRWERPSSKGKIFIIEPKENHDYIEPIAYYRWERLSSKGKILVSDLISDKYAEKHKYREDGWVKRTNTKRTWEY